MQTESNTRQRKSRQQANLRVLGNNKESQGEYQFKIEFLFFQEDGTYIAYCPALDISSPGESFNETVGNFYEMFQLHIECCIENNTLHDDLLAHGWVLEKEDVLPPQFSSLVSKKEVKTVGLCYSTLGTVSDCPDTDGTMLS